MVTAKCRRTHVICEGLPSVCTTTQRPLPETESTIKEFAPSAKLTYKTLEYEGPLTQKQLVERSRLPARTVRDAVRTLQDHGYLEERLHKGDARQRLYVLHSDVDQFSE